MTGTHDAVPADRDVAGWFVRRAGLARFTTFACALGLALSAMTGAQPVVALAGLTAAVACALGGVGLHRARSWCATPMVRSSAAWLLILSVLAVGLFGGYLVGNLRVARLMDGVLQSRVGDVVEAELCITGPARSGGGWQSAAAVVRRLSARSSGAIDQGVGETVLLEVPPADEASTGAVAGPSITQGMIVTLKGKIEAPEGPSDSGYNQARQLLHQGIEVVLRAESPNSVTVIGKRGGVSGWFDRLRASAKADLSRGPNPAVSEVLQGVVMGDTVGIDEEWLTAFRRSGTAHMLSVSGLHVASLAAIMIGLARLFGAARWVGFVLAAAAALLMIPFVGSSPPIVRAAAMICVVLVGRWVGRGRDQWQVLALAAAVVLGLNPFAVFDVGFQLSFAAFLGMLLLMGPLQKALKWLPDGIASNVAVSVAASAGTAPVALVVFDQTSLVSPLANLLVVPALPLVTALGMASVLLGLVWNGFSTVFDTLASLPMMWTVQVSRLMAVAPVLEAGHLGRAFLGLAAGAVVLPGALALTGHVIRVPLGMPLPLSRRCMEWLRAHRPRDRRLAAGIAVMMVALGIVAGASAYTPVAGAFGTLRVIAHGGGWPDQVEVRVLDIGQGNAVVVRTPGHHVLLFDGGSADCRLADQLRELGVRTLDLVVISHPHADHFAGLLEDIDDLEVETLVDQVQVITSEEYNAALGAARAGPVIADDSTEAEEYLRLRRVLADEGCRYVLAQTGYSVEVEGVSIRLFAPKRPLVMVNGPDPWAARGGEPSGDELNGASVVAVVSIGSIDVLIPGDAEADVLSRYDLPPTEAVVVSHHGSRGAVSEALLREWGTQAAFISSGEGNPFGHPDSTTVSLLQESVDTVLRTDTVGWVSFTVNGDQMVITTERTPAQ